MSDRSHPPSASADSSRVQDLEREVRDLRARLGELEQERRHLAAVLDVLPVGVWLANAEGRLVARNKAAAEIWDRDAPLSERPDDYGDDFRAWRLDGTRIRSEDRGMARAIRDGETSVAEELSIETAEGKRRRILNYAAPIRDDAGEVTGGVAVNVDITARRQAEAHRTQILAAVAQAVIVTDVEGRVTYWNPAAERLYGWRRAEAEGKRILDLTVPPGFRNQADDLMRDVVAGEQWTGEFDVRRKDGTTFPARVSLSAIHDLDGDLLGFVGLSTDLTAEKQAERRREELIRTLEQERSRLEDIFEAAPAIMAVLGGPDHRFELVNPLYRATVGDRELVGRTVAEALPEIVEQGFVEILDRVWETGEPYVGTEEPILLENRGGAEPDEVFLNYVYQPVRDLHGDVSRIVVHAVDVTELVLARKRAEAASRVKSEFLHTMSHELRTPLNAVIGYADLIDAGVPVEAPEGVLNHVERIRLSARHLLGIIEDVLQVGSLESGQNEVDRETIDVDELLEEVRAIGQPLTRAKGLSLRVEQEPLPGPLVSDGSKLRQILVNLVGNAAKFTKSGSVDVSISPRGDDRVLIRVSDTGIGISDAELERLFEPFWQSDREKRRTQGTGLGLTIAKRVAEMLGGSVSVESREGLGSSFTVELPRVITRDE